MNDLIKNKLGILVLVTIVTSVFGSLVYAESHDPINMPDDFKVGDRVEVSVSGLEGDRYYEPCVVTEVRGNGYSVKCDGTEYSVQKGWVRAARTQPPPNKPIQNRGPERPDPAAKPQDNETNEQLFKFFDANESGWLSGRELQACQCIQFDKDSDNEVTKAEFMAGVASREKAAHPTDDDAALPAEANGECASNAPAINRSGSLKPSETLFKGAIYYNYNLAADGTGRGPLRVGVVFLSFQIGAAYANTVSNVPGVGAQRKNDAAPAGAAIYPVRSKHIVCEQYRDRSLRRQVESNYACFKNRDGEWVCGVDGFPKIVQLN